MKTLILSQTVLQTLFLLVFLPKISALGERPDNISICDWYAQTLFGANTAVNQQAVMLHITNTAIIGKFGQPNVSDVAVTGIGPVSVYNGSTVNLVAYFDTAFYSTNDGVTPYGVVKNFLDDGGPVPLSMGLPSNGNITSNQYKLLTHVYQYFGILLGCSLQGTEGFPAYTGRQSMYEVHKYMYVDPYEQGWFVDQLTAAAASIGFSQKDTTIWFNTMTGLFSFRCAPETAISATSGKWLQSICVAPSCPLYPNATEADCAPYEKDHLSAPEVYNATLAGVYTKGGTATATATATATVNGTGTATKTSVTPTVVKTGAVERNLVPIGMVIGSLALVLVQ